MASSNTQNIGQQKLVDEHFDMHSAYWRDVYKDRDILGIIYRRRQATALNFIDGLALPKTAHLLEIGCGAGFMTAALAERGFVIEAIDHAQAMVDLTQEHVRQKGILNRVSVCTGDIHELSYEDQTFDLIIALGVVPWLHDFKKALIEILRVTKPSGYIILTMDNAFRATTLLDPKTFPPINWIRSLVRRKGERAGLLSRWKPDTNAPPYSQHSPRGFNRSLCEAGLTILKNASVGFGPFTLLGHNVFPESLGIKINDRLQRYADKKYPFLRSTGSMYIILAKKNKKRFGN